MLKQIISVLFLLSTYAISAQNIDYSILDTLQKNKENELYISVKLLDYGKLGYSIDKDTLSRILQTDKKYFTTNIKVKLFESEINFLINDKKFNHKKFYDEVLQNNEITYGQNVVLQLKLYYRKQKIIAAVIEKYICKLSN